MRLSSAISIAFLAITAIASPAPKVKSFARSTGPQISLDYATYQGQNRYAGVDSFLGIPFAKAGRLDNPVICSTANCAQSEIQDATQYGPACPQQQLTATQIRPGAEFISGLLSAIEQAAFAPLLNQAEDCLSINVQRPAGLNSTAGLPVMVWIFGGGFQLGSSASPGAEGTALPGSAYEGARIVQRSIEMGQPIVFVSMNYRVNAFGTLASQELTDAGVTNLALKDQRTALRWVQKYIQAFGGEKTKVTLFGESAGSVSIALQMQLNGGDEEGLFRGAIMASGGVFKLKDYRVGQETFDYIANKTGCGGSVDKLNCIRQADYNLMYNAVQQLPNFFSYKGLAIPWNPRPDGSFLPDSPHRLLRQGKISKVPYIIGDMKDEGTLFSLVPQLNLTTDADFRSFWQTNYFPQLSPSQVKAFTDLFPQNHSAGSPFDTGLLNAIGPQYKRLAAAQGDYVFEAGRRDLLNYTFARQPAYTYQIEQSLPILGQLAPLRSLTGVPVLGSFHASEVLFNAFASVPATVSMNTLNIMSTFISFVNTLDPNQHGLALPRWPTWTLRERAMFKYQESGPVIIKDDYRERAMAFVNQNADVYMI